MRYSNRYRAGAGVLAGAMLVTAFTGAVQANAEPAAAAEPENLLTNVGFEEGAETLALAGWSPLWIGSEKYISVVSDPVSEGVQSIRILDENEAGGAGLISDAFVVTAGETYEFSFDQLRTSGHLLPTMHYFDEAGVRISAPYAVERSTVGSWERSSNEFLTPADAVTAQAMFYTAGAGLVDTVVDNAYFGIPRELEPEASIPDQVTAQDPDISYIGMPVSSRITRNPVLGEENGESMIYAVYRGNKDTDYPATFVASNTRTGEIVRALSMPGADFATEVRASSTGKIYVTTTGIYALWEYDPATTTVRNIGLINPASPGDGYGFSMAAADAGKMYVGSYPKGFLYLYDPADDTIANLGAVDPTQAYIKSLAYDAERQNLYVSAGGSASQLWKVSADGTKTALLSEEAAPGSTTQSFLSTLTWTGDRLFARGNNSELLVIGVDDQIEYWRGDGKEAMGYLVTERPDAPGKYVFTFQTGFWEYDSATRTSRDLGIETNGYLSDAFWEERESGWFMVAATHEGTIQVNFATGERETHTIDYRNPIIVQKLFNGPDSMYASGYMKGLAPFDAETGEVSETYQEGQFESAAVRDGKLLLGAYGYALLVELDPTTGVFREIYSLREEGQDRPFGLDYDPVSDRSFMASVPYYGSHQGALTMHDFARGETKVFKEEIVPNQAFIDVLHHDGLVYLGTTIDGGLGGEPSGETDAHFVVWDPKTEQVVHDIIPVAGDEGVTGLMVGPDGLIWGVSEDTVFKYDPAQGKIVYSEKLLGNRYGSSTVWAWAYLAIGSDGNVYGTNRSSFFKIDADTMQYSKIVDGTGNYLVADDNGDVFFSSSAYLFKYDVADAPAIECTRVVEGTVRGGLVVGGGESVCGSGVKITGAIEVQAGGALRLDASTLRGSFSANGAAAVEIRSSELAGSVSVVGVTDSFVFAGNALRGSMVCAENVAALDDEGSVSTVSGSVSGCGDM